MPDDHDRDEASVRRAMRGRLAQLVEEIGRPTAVAMAGRAFLANLDASVTAILEAQDGTTRGRAAHALAGSAETLGAAALGATARAVMLSAREAPDAPLDEQVRARLLTDAGRAAAVLDEELVDLEVA